ncbi:MAG: hypothetical protein K0R54_2251 [Clostridiaceae bacterium]|jgi:hypothetical protein|nr:hypothetical protein [Clostridiaceae bacterium]
MFSKLFRKIHSNYMDTHYVQEFKVPEVKPNKSKVLIVGLGKSATYNIKQPKGKKR